RLRAHARHPRGGRERVERADPVLWLDGAVRAAPASRRRGRAAVARRRRRGGALRVGQRVAALPRRDALRTDRLAARRDRGARGRVLRLPPAHGARRTLTRAARVRPEARIRTRAAVAATPGGE